MRTTPIGLQIRPMAEADYRDVYRIYRQLFSRAFLGGDGVFSRIFQKFFGTSDREAFVATVNEHVIGFVTLYYLDVLHHSGLVASIQDLVVTEEFRGRGVGKSMIEFVKRQVTEKQCKGLEVATDLWRSGAKSFYEQYGIQGRNIMAVR
jgi:ribosomal protein S18 acetylase RimI-like enzyme